MSLMSAVRYLNTRKEQSAEKINPDLVNWFIQESKCISVIPDHLIEHRGNQSQVARKLGIQRSTVNKYSTDVDGKNHFLINGKLFTCSAQRGKKS